MTRYYFDRKTQKMIEGHPPDENIYYGQAPITIFDSMPKTYHHGIEREIESRSEWKAADNAAGTITFGSQEEARPRIDEANEEKRRKAEKRKASLTAWQAYKENPKEVHDRVEKQSIEKIEKLKKIGIEI